MSNYTISTFTDIQLENSYAVATSECMYLSNTKDVKGGKVFVWSMI